MDGSNGTRATGRPRKGSPAPPTVGEINRSDLERRTRYSLPHISRILNGKRTPSLRCAEELAAALGIRVDEFIALLPARIPAK